MICRRDDENQLMLLDHDHPSEPSHHLTNGPKLLKTIESDRSKIKNHRKNHGLKKTFDGDGLTVANAADGGLKKTLTIPLF